MHNVKSPATDDNAIELEIQAKGKIADRVKPSDIEANIASAHFFTAAQGYHGAAISQVYENAGVITNDTAAPPPKALGLLTICVLVLRNGFTVTGESACASPENFDEEIGRKIARQNAIQKIWPLMGYELKQRLHAAATADAAYKRSEG